MYDTTLKREAEILIKLALSEDLGEEGDVTSRAIFTDQEGTAVLTSKDTGILAGIEVFKRVFKRVDEDIRIHLFEEDGAALSPGQQAAEMNGRVLSLLQAERTALNFLSYLSGIATKTKEYVSAASGGAVILDTRKTLPGYRGLAKYAVTVGGGGNHRMGLFDMVLIKDNHIDACGSLRGAVERVRGTWENGYRIEVECRTLEEVREALELQVDTVLLDNMTPDTVHEAVSLRRGLGRTDVLFEVSGNINADRVRRYSPLGIEFISVGGLTHSVEAFDFSMTIKP